MIVKMQTGRSFHGAALYYLHDKKHQHELLRLSDERVAWTATRNTATNVPELAISEMIAVAQFQDELKRESGQVLSGRPCEEPVMTMSFSWHPLEKPTKEHMIATATSFLEHMGWDEHQALLLAHNDTPHQHVHVVLNRIHPATGLVHDDSFSHNRSENWREAYEHEHGKVRGPGRACHSMHHDFAVEANAISARYAELEATAARSQEKIERDQLGQRHQFERETFLNSRHSQFREARQRAYHETRQAYAPQWVQHYAKAEKAREAAQHSRNDTAARALHFAREGDFPAAWQSVGDRDSASRDVRQDIYKERQQLRTEQRAETRERQDEACTELYDQRAEEFTAIKGRQKEERAELKELQAARETGQPFDQQRLAQLMAGAPTHAADKSVVPEPQHHEPAGLKREATRQVEQETEHAAAVERAPRRDALDGLAGGIGKLAEIASDIIAGILAPETEQQRAGREALAEAQAEAAPEREAAQQAQEVADRQSAYERQQSAEERFRAYFNEHGGRLRAEEEERRQKNRDRER
jgi:relaxase-like protein